MMNFVEEEEEKGYYCNNEDQEEDDEEVVMIREISSNNFPFSSSSSSSVSSKYKDTAAAAAAVHLSLGTFDSRQDHNKTQQQSGFDFDKKQDLVMDLSLGNHKDNDHEESCYESVEKEHMFDKVVTPSDVGKLNRLVIPKQHAEKYFPLDSSSIEKGLLLNFEDRNGKTWRFRYSYWNSSQSYVMTKGWSRFVKEKKLVAGDTVSFQRGVGELVKARLYIDWKLRPNALDPSPFAHIQLRNQFNFLQPVRWEPICMSRNYQPLHRLNYSIDPYNHRHHHHFQHQHQQQAITYSSMSQYYQIGALQGEPMVIDSVPVIEANNNKASAKRLRLFGVNMDCPNPTQDESSSSIPLSNTQAEYSNKGKSSLSIVLGL
ncbi:hypothetical protein Goklo_008543 [Gossypium klotzschianum]|uniref:TF-B3 domain-containing protein n=1 Tax=Gossypium klotzschianum TaxID=34286 RepID=A0A7J8V129_9ROSI|nr:hypothetical protein [Gossypium klotzschianum]